MTTGLCKGRIVRHGLGISSGKSTPFVNVVFDVDGEQIPAQIWITDKAMGMARQKLRKCGFDVDKCNLRELEDNHELLAGNAVDLDITDEEFNGQTRLKCEIVTRSVPDKKRCDQLTQALRNVKCAEVVPAGEQVSDEDIPF